MPEICSRFIDVHVFRRKTGHAGARRLGSTGMRVATNAVDEWLVMKRAPGILLGGTWQMVSGTIEPREKAYEAALRELREETGLQPIHFYQASYVNRFYLAERDQIVLTPVFAAEVSADAEVQLSAEHTAHEWVGHAEAASRFPWPGQKRSLQVIRDQFLLGDPYPQSILDHLIGGRKAAARPSPSKK